MPPQKRMECYRLLFNHLAWIKHQFLSGIRDSRKVGNLWGMMRGVGGVRKSIYQSWLAKGLGLGLLCWGCKGVQQEIPWEEASTLQIEVSGISTRTMHQSTTPIFVTDYFDQGGHQDSSSPPYRPNVAPCDFCLFPNLSCRYETTKEMKKAVTKVTDTLTQEDFQGTFEKLLQPKEIASKGIRISCMYHQ